MVDRGGNACCRHGAAQESQLEYTRQIGGGPALGYFQMKPETHDGCWTNTINYAD
jgi:hypothetical protein